MKSCEWVVTRVRVRELFGRLRGMPPSFFVLVAAVVTSVAVVSSAGASAASERASLRDEIAAGYGRLQELSSELARVDESRPAAEDETRMRVALYSARSAGEAVATLQTEYMNIAATESTTPGQSDGYFARMRANASALGAYLSDDAQGGKTPWFGYEGFSWRFETTYEFATTEVDCLWICEDAEGRVGAFATATYHVEGNVFDDVSTYVTQYGAEVSALPADNYSKFTQGADADETSANLDARVTYGLDEDGNVVDENGDAYAGPRPSREMTDEEYAAWAERYDSAFEAARAYREYVQASGGGDE